MIPLNDTIAAIATPIGEGGISVIRISGSAAREVADKHFQGKSPLGSVSTHTAHFGKFVDNSGAIIDDVVATVFVQPQSYTGEDVVEISCHGGMLVTQRILAEIINNGTRLATPGEFTKRAFLNGKLDLSQAEAVADLIQARSRAAHAVSISQLEGRLSDEVGAIRKTLTDLASLIELGLDFSEEDLSFASHEQITASIAQVQGKINSMIESYSSGRVCKEGIRVVLTGRPNVGKSSVLNRLLNTERAIVTEIPGTTRDLIEEAITIGGVSYVLVDTAGLRDSSDIVEKEGIARSEQQIRNADIVLLILDLSVELNDFESALISRLKDLEKPIILVGNKSDLIDDVAKAKPGVHAGAREVVVSAKLNTGFDDLRDALAAGSSVDNFSEKSFLVSNLRHQQCLVSASESLKKAAASVAASMTGEFISLDIRKACDALGEIIGVVTNDDILNNIFSRFCIGK
ncbi:MAG TPA: tRNA uridine-5-carboxymethylaminomethyl(34) synthesis GTPase MnmE [Bacteroidota bacterium]|nr:tRNA uridine-5-carboxymethylaminomethyl(34) synthesis GTPase MnmE [Bacteroidota bacterium]